MSHEMRTVRLHKRYGNEFCDRADIPTWLLDRFLEGGRFMARIYAALARIASSVRLIPFLMESSFTD